MAKTEYAPLGILEGREYFTATPPESDKYFAWRVPSIREAIRAEEGWKIISADYCVHPDTKILTSNLQWSQIGTIKPGMRVVGFDEMSGQSFNSSGRGCYRRLMHTTPVERITELKQPCVRIVTTAGDLICSKLHRWLIRKYASSGKLYWARACNLQVGQRIAYFGEPWKTDHSWESGYLSGFFDGEGYVHQGIGFGQKPGPVYDKVTELLLLRGFNPVESKNANGCHRGRLSGGTYSALKFIGEVRPVRMLRDASKLIEGHDITGRYRQSQEILAVEDIGERDVIGIQTGTNTFLANGFLSHNSQIEVKLMAFLSQDPWLIEAINSTDELGNHKDIHSYMCCEINGYDYAFFYDVLKGHYKHEECHKFNQQQLFAMHDEFTAKRGETKAVTFGVPYGAGEETVGKNIRSKKFVFPDGTVGLEPMEMAKRRANTLMADYFKKAWKLKQWLNGEKFFAQENGETRSIWGRRRLYDVPANDDPECKQKLGKIGREAGNHPIQASNVDITKMALVRFYSALRGGRLAGPLLYIAKLLMAVHDEIVCTSPVKHAYSIPAKEAEKILHDRKASPELKRSVLGPVPLLLEQTMADAYNVITNEVYLRVKRVQDGQIYQLKDVWNAVDVVVGDYWSKE